MRFIYYCALTIFAKSWICWSPFLSMLTSCKMFGQFNKSVITELTNRIKITIMTFKIRSRLSWIGWCHRRNTSTLLRPIWGMVWWRICLRWKLWVRCRNWIARATLTTKWLRLIRSISSSLNLTFVERRRLVALPSGFINTSILAVQLSEKRKQLNL